MFNRGAKTPDPLTERQRIAAEMRQVLQTHVMDCWFPRCLDLERGGFISDFDRRWRPGPGAHRMLEFQARQTRVAAQLAIALPAEGRWQEYALHGLRFLREGMWDRERGGWFWLVSNSGEPLAGATKHAHSAAYSVQAAALVFQATGERAALEHAEEGLEWCDRFAHDNEFGGFHGWLTRDGSVIRSRGEVPAGAGDVEPLGHDIGLKDVNVNGDFFEALLDLTANSDSRRALELRDEFADLYLNRMTTPGGEVHYTFHPNWMPQPGPEWYGYGFQAAHRMLTAARTMPGRRLQLETRARTIAAHTIRRAWRKGGGFRFGGPAGAASHLEGSDLRAPVRSWWVQFEGLRVLALFAAREEAPGAYSHLLEVQWRFVRKHLLDGQYGGVYSRAKADTLLTQQPWLPRRDWAFRKGSDWKDASHETSALLASIAALSQRPAAIAAAAGAS